MIVTEFILKQCLRNGIRHHFMTLCPGVNAVTAENCGIVVRIIDVVHAADKIQIDYCYIIQRSYLDDRVTQITQGISVNIGLGLIPVALRSHRTIPRSDHRRQEIELRIMQAVGIPKLLNALAPHSHRTVNGRAVCRIDVSKLVVALCRSTEIIDTQGNGDNVRALQIRLCKSTNISGSASIGAKSCAADTKADILHPKLLCQQSPKK